MVVEPGDDRRRTGLIRPANDGDVTDMVVEQTSSNYGAVSSNRGMIVERVRVMSRIWSANERVLYSSSDGRRTMGCHGYGVNKSRKIAPRVYCHP